MENPSEPDEATAACFGNARSLTDTHCELVSLNTGRSVTNVDELERNTPNFAIPTPRFANKFSTWNLPSHAEGAYPQNCMVEQPRNQVSKMHFDKFLNTFAFQCGKTSFKTEVCSCSNFPTEAMLWIKEVEIVESADDLKTWRSASIPEFLRCLMRRWRPP